LASTFVAFASSREDARASVAFAAAFALASAFNVSAFDAFGAAAFALVPVDERHGDVEALGQPDLVVRAEIDALHVPPLSSFLLG